MFNLLILTIKASLAVTSVMFWLASLTSVLWGLAFVTMMSFGLQVQSWFWVFAGPVVVVFLAGCAGILGALLWYISQGLRLSR